MRGNETPGRIVTNFCTGVGVHDVITSADFYDCSLLGLSVVGGQSLGFSIDLHRRPYNTLAVPCECVINRGVARIFEWGDGARSEAPKVPSGGGVWAVPPPQKNFDYLTLKWCILVRI